MKLGKIVQKTIKIAGTISKVSVQLGADIIGTVAEKIDDDPEIKRKISEYGRIKGQAIKETTSEAATKSSEIVDKAVETSVNTLKDGSTIVKNSINQVKEGIDKSIKKMNTYDDPIKDNYDNKSNYNPMSNSNNKYSEHKSKDIIKEKNQKKTSNEPIPNKLIANLVGFSNQQQVLNNLTEGDKLELLRENGNMWDKNAIKVQRDMYNVLGYISKDVQEMIAPLMDKGENFYCEVLEVIRDSANVNAITLLIKVEATISNNIDKLKENNLVPNNNNKSTEDKNVDSPNNQKINAETVNKPIKDINSQSESQKWLSMIKSGMLISLKTPFGLSLGHDVMEVAIPIVQKYFDTKYNESVEGFFADVFGNLDHNIMSSINLFKNKYNYHPKNNELINLALKELYRQDCKIFEEIQNGYFPVEVYHLVWLVLLDVFEKTKDGDRTMYLFYDATSIYIRAKNSASNKIQPLNIQV